MLDPKTDTTATIPVEDIVLAYSQPEHNPELYSDPALEHHGEGDPGSVAADLTETESPSVDASSTRTVEGDESIPQRLHDTLNLPLVTQKISEWQWPSNDTKQETATTGWFHWTLGLLGNTFTGASQGGPSESAKDKLDLQRRLDLLKECAWSPEAREEYQQCLDRASTCPMKGVSADLDYADVSHRSNLNCAIKRFPVFKVESKHDLEDFHQTFAHGTEGGDQLAAWEDAGPSAYATRFR